MKKYLFILVVLCLAISACTAEGQDPSAALIGDWKLESYGPADSLSPAVPDTEAGITFDEDGTVGGNSGCNGYGGNYTVADGQITFSEIFSTLMFCDEAIGAQEEAMYQVLTETASYTIEGNTLTLTNNGRTLVFQR